MDKLRDKGCDPRPPLPDPLRFLADQVRSVCYILDTTRAKPIVAGGTGTGRWRISDIPPGYYQIDYSIAPNNPPKTGDPADSTNAYMTLVELKTPVLGREGDTRHLAYDTYPGTDSTPASDTRQGFVNGAIDVYIEATISALGGTFRCGGSITLTPIGVDMQIIAPSAIGTAA